MRPGREGDCLPRLALRPKEAAAALGVSERTLREMLPELPHVRMGSRVVIPIDPLREWLLSRSRAEATAAKTAVEEILASLEDTLTEKV